MQFNFVALKPHVIDIFSRNSHPINGEINFCRLIRKMNDGIEVEIGYWHTFLHCKPLYTKKLFFCSYEELYKEIKTQEN